MMLLNDSFNLQSYGNNEKCLEICFKFDPFWLHIYIYTLDR